MKFDIKDIEFLSSEDHKKYLRYKKWTTSSHGAENLPVSFLLTFAIILILLSTKYWTDWVGSKGFDSIFFDYIT